MPHNDIPVADISSIDTVAVSHALHAALSRAFLDLPLGEAIRPLPQIAAPRTEDPVFLRLKQIGKPLAGSAQETLNALQNMLTAGHAPGKFTVIFILASDGNQNSIYIGAQSHEAGKSAKSFLRSMGNFLESNLPGTQLIACNADDDVFLNSFQQIGDDSEDELSYGIALTGVPSFKSGENSGSPQTLDRMLNGMRGRPFIYVVIAEPVSGWEVDNIIHSCRDLISDVHTIIKTDVTHSTNIQQTQGGGEAQTTTDSTSKTESETHEETTDEISRWQSFKENIIWTNLGMNKPIEESVNSTTKSTTVHHANSHSSSTNWSVALSAGKNMGQEYINTHAQAVETLLQQYVKRFEQSRALGCWNVGVYLFANRKNVAEQGAMQMKALLTGEKSLYEPIRTHELHNIWVDSVLKKIRNFEQPILALVKPNIEHGRQLTHADRLEHLLGANFSQLTTPLNTEELALLTNLPQREIAGIPLIPTTTFNLNVVPPNSDDIVLGKLLEGGRPISSTYGISPHTLTKHTLVTGTTGSGKSTTSMRLLNELFHQNVPFMVIEPTKDKYVEWAMAANKKLPPEERIRIFMPGAATKWRDQLLTEQLRLNPFDLVWLSKQHQPLVLSHIDRLKLILSASFPMQEALPFLLEEVLFAVYSKPFNWLGEQLPSFDTPRPTLQHMLDVIKDIIKQKVYKERISTNIITALMTRIQSLQRGWKAQLFDQQYSTPWAELFDRNVVVNLSQLGEDTDRAFAMMLLLQFLYEYRLAQRETNLLQNETKPLQHITVVEEAHRVLKGAATGMSNDAQGKVAEMFSDIMLEISPYREGMLLVDQVPTKLLPDAIKNTNLKIVHRLVAKDDQDAMSGSMTLTPDQAALINRLRIGQAIVFGNQDDMAAWVQVTLKDEAHRLD